MPQRPITPMRFFIYEFVTGGGWWSIDCGSLPTDGLFREGFAMLQALAADFAEIGTVSVLRDIRCDFPLTELDVHDVESQGHEQHQFMKLVQQTDWTVVIAPEFGRHLLRRCGWVERQGGRLLSPSSAFVEIASDKQRTAEQLRAAGIAVPWGLPVSRSIDTASLRFPAVLKPRDGAGSQNVRLVSDWAQAMEWSVPGHEYRLEEFHSGMPASVSVLMGPDRFLVLPASEQLLTNDGHFQYLGGVTPMSPDLCRRAERIARATIAALPAAVGYVGIDLVLGSADDGSEDVVIEVNPRLTTSYLGLRQIADGNLAAAMVRTAEGQPTDLSFRSVPVQFSAVCLQSSCKGMTERYHVKGDR